MEESHIFCGKIYKTSYGLLVAICDSDLIGKKLNFGSKSIFVDKNFYCDKQLSEVEAIRLLREATSLNLLGEKIVELAVKLGLVHTASIQYLELGKQKVPYAIVQIFSI